MDSIVSVSAMTDGKFRCNTLAGVIAALAKGAFALNIDADASKPLIDQVVVWLASNTTKWPSNQINIGCLEPDWAPPTQTFNKYDARKWRAKLAAAKTDWVGRETYSGAYGMLVNNALSKK